MVSEILDLCQILLLCIPERFMLFVDSLQDSISAFNMEKSFETAFPKIRGIVTHHRPTLEDFTEFIYTKICMGLFEDVKVGQSLGGRMAEVKLDIVHLMIVMILVMNLTIMIRWFSEKQQETDGN